MTLIAVALERDAAAYLLAGIRRARDEAMLNGHRPPASLAVLEQVLRASFAPTGADRSRQEPTVRAGRAEPPRSVSAMLTTREVAAALGVSERTIERRVAEGAMPSVKIGSARRIPRAAFDVLGAARSQRTGAEDA